MIHAFKQELKDSAALAMGGLVAAARSDCGLFCELVLRDEETQEPIRSQAMHYEWHDAIATGANVVLWAYPESGKSQQLVIGRTLWNLGRNPRKRIAILAASEERAKKLLGSIRRYIESSEMVRTIFPELRPGKIWTDKFIEVRRSGIVKDPSVQVISPDSVVQGTRLDELLVDDVLTENNTRTQYRREQLETWVRTSVFTRMSRTAQIIFLANAFHPEDMAHRLAQQGWWAKKYPIVDEVGRSTWPERYTLKDIEKKRKVMGPLEFTRAFMCEPRDESTARFRTEWIAGCQEIGEGYRLYKDLGDLAADMPEDIAEAFEAHREQVIVADAANRLGGNVALPEGFRCFTGVDLGVSRKDSADPSVLFTILVWPDNTRQVIDIQRGRWTAPEIVARVINTQSRFHSSVWVESNAAQDFLVQWMRRDAPGVTIHSFLTGRNKLNLEYGVESLGAELAAGMWLIPAIKGYSPDIVEAWIREMLNYSPEVHTGDILMASWIAREAARLNLRKRGVGVRVLG